MLSARQMASWKPRTTILLQRNQNFEEMLHQVHCSCRRPCWKV